MTSSTGRRGFLRRFAGAAALLLLSGSFVQPAAAQTATGPVAAGSPEVRPANRHDTSPALTGLPTLPPQTGRAFTRKLLPNRVGTEGATGDAAVQETAPGPSAPSVLKGFAGLSNADNAAVLGTRVLPPDTNGDIGPNHYVQWVNLVLAIYDRDGNKVFGPVAGNALWQGFGGPCESTNDGDPIVLYDHLSDRWMISQFALPNFPRGPFYQCMAVSATGNPTGSWHRYEFTISQDKLNDYPKFGVWPDAYYMAVNQFTCNAVMCQWGGQGVVAFERDRMLNGLSARMVYFDLFDIDSNLGGMLPSDLDGPAPPAGAPNTFVEVDDNAWGYSPDQLQRWNFHVDWTDPTLSTFTLDGTNPTAAFDSDMCGYSRNCISQPGGTNLDAISDRLMYRLQYRNFGTYETLVVNHTVDVNGSDRAGIRWYELRDTGSGWSIYQQGTFSPDTNHRWMASAAMNGIGDIALGYSISSTNVYPSVRVTGRFAGDAAGVMTQGETTLVNGAWYQAHSSGRYGDYSMMAVDPVDDCTFWYTQEYYAANDPNTTAEWTTWIGSFKLRDCGPVDNPPTVTLVNPADGATVSGTVPIEIDASDAEDAVGTLTVEWNVDGGTWQPASYVSADRYVASWGTASFSDGPHTVNARATDSGGNTAIDSNAVTVDNEPDPPTLHVGDLDRSSSRQGSSWTATVTITVHDANHNPVANATVSGSWSNGGTSVVCTTDASGQCTVTKSSISKRTKSVTYTVSGVAHSSLTYDPTANHDPDGDSDGTSITVPKP